MTNKTKKIIIAACGVVEAVVVAIVSVVGTSSVYNSKIENMIKNDVSSSIVINNNASYSDAITALIQQYNELKEAYDDLRNNSKEALNANTMEPEEHKDSLNSEPLSKIDLIGNIEPFDPDSGFKKYENETFRMSGKDFSKGFTINCWSNEKGVKFNLEKKYSKMVFYMGHVDDSYVEGKFILNIELDGVKKETITMTADDFVTQKELALNQANYIKFCWSGTVGHQSGIYGLGNIELIP